jgi:uncharacterized delta-60 repeat protein
MVLRLNTDGSRDTTFGSNGVVTHNASLTTLGKGSAIAMALQTIGGQERIVLAGYGYDATTKQQQNNAKDKYWLMRLLPNGSIDPGFGASGRVSTSFFGLGDIAFSIDIDSQNRIVAAGQSGVGPCDGDASFARYLTNGSLDPTFSGDGRLTVDIFNGLGNANRAVKVQSINGDDKIVGFGQTERAAGLHDMAIIRLNSDGTGDSTFGSGAFGAGKVTLDISPNDYVWAGTLYPDGRMAIAGVTDNGTYASVARFMP